MQGYCSSAVCLRLSGPQYLILMVMVGCNYPASPKNLPHLVNPLLTHFFLMLLTTEWGCGTGH